MAKTKKVSDDALVKLLQDRISTSTSWVDGKLSDERKKVIDHYEARLPARSPRGGSAFIATKVADNTEALHAQLLETFSAGTDIVSFTPVGPEDVQMARIATKYCSYVVFSRNDGLRIFSDVIKDALMYRFGVVKVYWDKRVEDVEYRVPAELMDDPEAARAFVINEKGEPAEDFDETGVYTIQEDTSQVVIEVVDPAHFLVSSAAKNLKTCFKAHRVEVSRSQLIDTWGMTAGEVEDLGGDAIINANDAVTNRSGAMDGNIFDSEVTEIIGEDEDTYWLYDCYFQGNLDGKGIRHWNAVMVGNRIIQKAPVSDHPFVGFTPLPMPHRLLGSSFAHNLIQTQNATTAIVRSLIDHTVITTNPRTLVQIGAVRNPAELTDARLGGIVNVSRMDGVMPLPQPPMNPHAFSILEKLNMEAEENSGISKLSQGLDKNSLSGRNSAASLEQQATNGSIRQKIIARLFAQDFLRALWLRIYSLCIENCKREEVFEVAGDWVNVTPSAWRSRKDVTVEMSLGYGEAEKQTQRLMMLDQLLAADPTANHLYTLENRYAMKRKIFEMLGIRDPDTYYSRPDKVPQPPPPVEIQLKTEMAAMQREIAMAKQKLSEAQFELEQMKTMADISVKSRDQALDHDIKTQQMAIKAAEVRLDNEVAMRELAILEKTAATQEITAVASPNS
jgi:hypothetical protein